MTLEHSFTLCQLDALYHIQGGCISHSIGPLQARLKASADEPDSVYSKLTNSTFHWFGVSAAMAETVEDSDNLMHITTREVVATYRRKLENAALDAS